ncbi:MAG: DNA repair protein RecO [Parcubacteria group bacterium]|nr:DNA repair protein RecO [Parcubacteria group bacterium]
MTEYFTEALVLDQEDIGEGDAWIYLYTQKLGKIRARAASIRKVTSKLAGHLQPLNFAAVRIVEKNGLRLVDGLSLGKVRAARQAAALSAALLVKEIAAEYQPDPVVWHFLKTIFLSGKDEYLDNRKMILKALGFESPSDKCQACRRQPFTHFAYQDAQFLCARCVQDFKLRDNEVQLI